MKISDLARQTGVSATTIRHYEAEKLLSVPTRGDNNYRAYGSSHISELIFVRNCRALNMTFEEIRVLLALKTRRDVDCSAANLLLAEHIEHIDAELKKLKSVRTELVSLQALCTEASATADCGILNGIATRERLPTEQSDQRSHRNRHGV